jgi:putative flippase GtrA
MTCAFEQLRQLRSIYLDRSICGQTALCCWEPIESGIEMSSNRGERPQRSQRAHGCLRHPVFTLHSWPLQNGFAMKIPSSSAFRFVLVGLSNTALSLAVIWIGLTGFGLSDVHANVIGYVVGFAWSFMLNRSWTFRQRGSIGAGFLRFALVCAAAYCANLVVLVSLASQFGKGVFWTQVAGMVAYTAISYGGSRYFAFPRTSAEPVR